MQARYQAHLVDRNVVTDACHDILENTTSGHVEQQIIGDGVLRATTPSHPSTWRTCSRYPRALTRAGGIALRRDFSLDELAYQCPGEVTIPGLTGQHVHCGHKARAEVRFRAGRFLLRHSTSVGSKTTTRGAKVPGPPLAALDSYF
jgi:hypothetical protein